MGYGAAAEPAAPFGPRALPLMLLASALGLAAISWLQPSLFIRTLLPALFLPPIAMAALLRPSLALLGVLILIPLGPNELLPMGASQSTALAKIAGIAAAGLCALRYGLSKQFNGPAFGFIAATALSGAFGAEIASLTFGGAMRSLVGSVAPFAFISARYHPRIFRPALLIILAGPLASVLLSVLAAPLGIGNGPINNGRLDGMLHPANLAALALTAMGAAMLEMVRGDRRMVFWLGLNTVILIGSGARVPLLLGILMGGGILLMSRTTHFRFGHKVRLAALATPVMLVGVALFGERIIERSFRNHAGGAGFQLSGRDIMWELFIDVIQRSPWFGHGIGAGAVAIRMEDVALLGSNAAHNEYLRLAVDVGVVGVALIFLGFAVWIVREARRMPPGEAVVIWAAAVALALHCISDNALIALSLVVRIAWFALVFDRARNEAAARRLSRSSGRAWGEAGTR